MENKNTFILQDTEAFMRGDLDNVTVSGGRIVLDLVPGGYVPYGCYTSPAVPMPLFDTMRVSWNAGTPPGTAVEAQARVLVDGNWTSWSSFGRWSPYLAREGAQPSAKGAVVIGTDSLSLDSKTATQVQMRIYLYTKDEKVSPAVSLLGASVRALDVIPAGGRAVHARLHLMPYVVSRRAPSLLPLMDLAISLTSLTNRWGADILPEEFALAMRDCRPGQSGRNLSFAAATAGCWGFPCWVCWADLALLRAEVRAGYGVVVGLEATPAQLAQGYPALRYAALRGFASAAEGTVVLLIDPYAGNDDFDAEISLPMDDFLVAWNNTALCMRKRENGPLPGCPGRTSVWLRHMPELGPAVYHLYVNGEPHLLPDNFCGSPRTEAPGEAVDDSAPPVHGGVLAWSLPDEHPHATTAHRKMHFTSPGQGGLLLELPDPANEQRLPRKYTVYAIEESGCMFVGDVMV